jgi:hypothetical protein
MGRSTTTTTTTHHHRSLSKDESTSTSSPSKLGRSLMEKFHETESPSPTTLTQWFIRALGVYEIILSVFFLGINPMSDNIMLQRSIISCMLHFGQIGTVAVLAGLYGSEYGLYKQVEYQIGLFSMCLAHAVVFLPQKTGKGFLEHRLAVYHNALIILMLGVVYANFPGGKPEQEAETGSTSGTGTGGRVSKNEHMHIQSKMKQAKTVFILMALYSFMISLFGLIAPAQMYQSMSTELQYETMSDENKLMHDARMIILLAYGHLCMTSTMTKWETQQKILTVLGIGQFLWGIGSYSTKDFSTPEVASSWMTQGASHFAFSAMALGVAYT